jgi:hypothetical protein
VEERPTKKAKKQKEVEPTPTREASKRGGKRTPKVTSSQTTPSSTPTPGPVAAATLEGEAGKEQTGFFDGVLFAFVLFF